MTDHKPHLAEKLPERWEAVFQELLEDWQTGCPDGLDKIFGRLYDELKSAASRCLQGEAIDHTLQTTELVHELFLRLTKNQPPDLESPQQFVFFAIGLMRLILVDYARRKLSLKRGGQEEIIPLEETFVTVDQKALDPDTILEINQMVDALAQVDQRQSRIFALRTFLGLSQEEVARALQISERTVYREWRQAKRRLAAFRQLQLERA